MQNSTTATARAQPLVQRTALCECGHSIFFRNHLCLHCGRALGYLPEKARIASLDPVTAPSTTPPPASDTSTPTAAVTAWHEAGASADDGVVYVRCANFGLAPQCNWMVSQADSEINPLCRCCRLNRTIPDQSIAANGPLWRKVELAKRRLVSTVIALDLPLASKVSEDTERGLAFDLMVDVAPMRVTTGHNDGIITLNLKEADDAARETIRQTLHEPYRTLLGHMRHESGHYYWSRLLDGGPWHEPFRTLFGDERLDYAAALKKHYSKGHSTGWASVYVSAYASSHPWEDWAETWAHYLHMLDTLNTAQSFLLDNIQVDPMQDPFTQEVLYCNPDEQDAPDEEFLAMLNNWIGLTSALNEFSLSMGQPDLYPFVLSNAVVTKLHFVHRFIRAMKSTQ